MTTAHKIANKSYSEVAEFTTRHHSRHGIGRTARRIKTRLNRRAKRIDKALAFKDQA